MDTDPINHHQIRSHIAQREAMLERLNADTNTQFQVEALHDLIHALLLIDNALTTIGDRLLALQR